MRILLADAQPNVRYALHVLLANRPKLNLAGDATDAYELMSRLTADDPDMLILDWMLPGLDEVGSIATLRDIRPDMIIIALSGRPELGHAAIKAGADAFVSKIDPPERLLTAIDRFLSQNDRTPFATNSE
jgi:DNA-binding NarL/FixJ family response regulator